MHGSYIERNVDTSIFEDFKRVSIPLSRGPNSVILGNDELDLDESLVFAIYDKLIKNHADTLTLVELERFKNVLSEMVDALYTGPAVDYVVLKLEKNIVGT